MTTWKVIEWRNEPSVKDSTFMHCQCGESATVPTAKIGALVIATFGMNIVFDPPDFEPPPNYLPTVIQCRRCKRIYE